MGKYFGTDGIRGKANVTLTAETAFKVGRYLGWYFSQNGKGKIVIGKDTRLSSDMLENALAAGITSEGCDAYLTGYCPTPMISRLVQTGGFACGAMISASHNPYYDNGIKIFSNDGLKMKAEVENLIEEFIDGKVELEYRDDDRIGKVIDYSESHELYFNWLREEFPYDFHGLRLVVDTANGSAVTTAEKVLKAYGAEVTMLNNSPDGVNINTHCGSTHPEGMQEKVRSGNYDLGLAFDGDADRMILAAPDGSLITGDHMLYVMGKYFRDLGVLNNDTVVTTVMANLGLFKAMERENIRLASTDVGDKYVFERMCADDDIVGGEQSGHIIFKQHECTGDGLVTAIMFLHVMKETGKGALELCEGLKIYPQLLVNVRVSDKKAAMNDPEILAAIEQVNKEMNGNGRLLVRSSGTESLVRVMAEAETDEACAEIDEKIAVIVRRKYGI